MEIGLAFEAVSDIASALALHDPQAGFRYMAGFVFEYGSLDIFLLGYARIDLIRDNPNLALNRLDALVNSGYTSALYWRGVTHIDLENLESASEDLEAYLSLYPVGPQSEHARTLLDELQETE